MCQLHFSDASLLLLYLVGLFLPAVVRPILDSLEASKQVKAPPLADVSCSTTNSHLSAVSTSCVESSLFVCLDGSKFCVFFVVT